MHNDYKQKQLLIAHLYLIIADFQMSVKLVKMITQENKSMFAQSVYIYVLNRKNKQILLNHSCYIFFHIFLVKRGSICYFHFSNRDFTFSYWGNSQQVPPTNLPLIFALIILCYETPTTIRNPLKPTRRFVRIRAN